MLIALLWTACAKLAVVRRHKPPNLLTAWIEVSLPDVAFFALIFACFCALLYYRPRRIVARCALLLSAVLLVWAVLNAAWLIATGVQLQPGVLSVLAGDMVEFWPIVDTHLRLNLEYAVPFAITLLGVAAWFIWRLVRPRRLAAGSRRRLWLAAAASLVFALSLPAQILCRRWTDLGFAGKVLGFNSHWYALVSAVARPNGFGAGRVQTRWIPRVGQRRVTPPAAPREELPNVVLVMLESVPYAVSSLDNPQLGVTPNLLRLAGEGTEFDRTRVPISHTTKAWWAALTGTTPDTQPDYAEAILADQPYESLASILARVGYRSAFFQLSKGTFECAPGFFSNLAFDWAWFRENLGDPSAHLGYLAGDDFRMLDPAFDWAAGVGEPFLVVMMTSVAHDPYVVPDWYGQGSKDRYANYLRCVEFSDAFVGEVAKRLGERGLAERTLLCVIGDHGESFRPEQLGGRYVPYEEVVRVPWVMRLPGRLPAGLRIEWPCSQLDVTPTILSAIGFDVSRADFEGRNALQVQPADRRIHVASWLPNSPLGFVQGDRKWIYWPYENQLLEFDLSADPSERSPVPVHGAEKDRIVEVLLHWKQDAQIQFPARRFRERRVYDHWRTFSTGRSAWAYYVP